MLCLQYKGAGKGSDENVGTFYSTGEQTRHYHFVCAWTARPMGCSCAVFIPEGMKKRRKTERPAF